MDPVPVRHLRTPYDVHCRPTMMCPNRMAGPHPPKSLPSLRAPSIPSARHPSIPSARAPSVSNVRSPSAAKLIIPSIPSARRPSVVNAKGPPTPKERNIYCKQGRACKRANCNNNVGDIYEYHGAGGSLEDIDVTRPTRVPAPVAEQGMKPEKARRQMRSRKGGDCSENPGDVNGRGAGHPAAEQVVEGCSDEPCRKDVDILTRSDFTADLASRQRGYETRALEDSEVTRPTPTPTPTRIVLPVGVRVPAPVAAQGVKPEKARKQMRPDRSRKGGYCAENPGDVNGRGTGHPAAKQVVEGGSDEPSRKDLHMVDSGNVASELAFSQRRYTLEDSGDVL